MAYNDIKICRIIDELNAAIIDFHREILDEAIRFSSNRIVHEINNLLYLQLRSRLRVIQLVFVSDEEFEKMLP